MAMDFVQRSQSISQAIAALVIHSSDFQKPRTQLPGGTGNFRLDGVGTRKSSYQAPAGGGGVSNTVKTNRGMVTFGHGGRNIPQGMDVSAVEQSIANQVPRLKVGEFRNFNVNVNGFNVEVRAYGREGGIVNVGTYIFR